MRENGYLPPETDRKMQEPAGKRSAFIFIGRSF